MDQHQTRRSRLPRCVASLACVAMLLVTGACGSDGTTSNNDGAGSTSLADKTFSGTLSDGSAVSLIFAAATAVGAPPRSALVTQSRSGAAMTGSVAGTITPPGGTGIQVSGSYDPATGAFSITGGGYSLSGSYANGALQATGTRSGVSIAFVAMDTSAGAVAHYCGTYGGDKYGVLTFVVSGGKAYAFVNAAVLAGTASGTAVTMSGAVGSSTSVTVTGAVTSSDASGSWTATDGNTGTWAVSTAECRNAASTGSLCDKAATVGAELYSKLQPCLGSGTPANGGLPSGTECMSELAQCNASDAAILSTLLDCLHALPNLASCSTPDVTSWGNAADACSAAVAGQLSASCQAATQIN